MKAHLCGAAGVVLAILLTVGLMLAPRLTAIVIIAFAAVMLLTAIYMVGYIAASEWWRQ